MKEMCGTSQRSFRMGAADSCSRFSARRRLRSGENDCLVRDETEWRDGRNDGHGVPGHPRKKGGEQGGRAAGRGGLVNESARDVVNVGPGTQGPGRGVRSLSHLRAIPPRTAVSQRAATGASQKIRQYCY